MGDLVDIKPGGITTSELLDRRLREKRIIDRRLRGVSVDEIAQDEGMQPEQVNKALRKYAKRVADQTDDAAKTFRQLQLDRLDRMLETLDPLCQEGKMGAIDRALKVIALGARIAGVDKTPTIQVDDARGLLPGVQVTNYFHIDPTRLAAHEREFIDGSVEEPPELPA